MTLLILYTYKKSRKWIRIKENQTRILDSSNRNEFIKWNLVGRDRMGEMVPKHHGRGKDIGPLVVAVKQ